MNSEKHPLSSCVLEYVKRGNGLCVASWFYLAGAAIFVLSSAVAVALFHFDVLVKDQWRMFLNYFTMPFWGSLWVSQNGHRIFFPGLFFRLDNYLFSGTGTFLIFTSLVLNGLTALIIAREIWHCRLCDRNLARFSVGLIFITLFWMGNFRMLTWSLGFDSYLAAFAAVFAVYALAKFGSAWNTQRVQGGAKWFVSAILAAVVASFSVGNGSVIWPTLVIVAVLARLPWQISGLLTVVGAISGYAYLVDLDSGKVSLFQNLLNHPLAIVKFTAIFVSSAVLHVLDFILPLQSPAASLVGQLVGALAIAACIAVLIHVVLRREPIRRGEMVTIGVFLFGIGTGCLVALARVGQNPVEAALAPRYLMWSSLFWAGMIALLPYYYARPKAVAMRCAMGASLVILVITPFFLPTQMKRTLSSGFQAQRAAEAALALIVGVQDDQRVAYHLFKNPTLVYQVAGILRDRKLNIFADSFSRLPGSRAGDRFTVVPADRCTGALTKIKALPGRLPSGWEIAGWAWDIRGQRVPQLVLVTDSQRVIHGLARFTQRPKRTPATARIREQSLLLETTHRISKVFPSLRRVALLPSNLGRDLGWFGYVQHFENLEQSSFFAVLADGRSICPLEIEASLAAYNASRRSSKAGCGISGKLFSPFFFYGEKEASR